MHTCQGLSSHAQALAGLPRLACLDLSGCNHLTGAALAPIGTVTCLQTLKLQHCLRSGHPSPFTVSVCCACPCDTYVHD